eukprot:scaffold2039_cov255-Chaetoceros_neogracile.AAC.7
MDGIWNLAVLPDRLHACTQDQKLVDGIACPNYDPIPLTFKYADVHFIIRHEHLQSRLLDVLHFSRLFSKSVNLLLGEFGIMSFKRSPGR